MSEIKQMVTDSDKYLIRLGQKIAQIRDKKGITQYRLAKDLLMEQSNLARIENGKTNPTVRTLIKISDLLEVDIIELFTP